MEFWSTGSYSARQFSILIKDKKELTWELINWLTNDLSIQDFDVRIHLADWLMANQLVKDKKTIALMETWEYSSSSIQRRLFWYHQARLRWMGKTAFNNTLDLLDSFEKNMATEAPEVQWAMNFTVGKIGTYDSQFRDRCIAMGEKIGLYKDEK